MNRTAIYRKEHFNATHRLYNTTLSDAENLELYGRCSNQDYHDHKYELIVKLTSNEIETHVPIIDTKHLGDLLQEHVTEVFDKKNLNLELEAFKILEPTTENIARVIYYMLREKIDQQFELKIFLYETKRNYAEYPG